MTITETTGADLARIALMAARKAAAAQGEQSRARAKPKHRPTARRGDGRDPLDLTTLLKRLADEHGWQTPLAGGTVIDRWKHIVSGDVAERLQPVHFDESTRRLDLLPISPAWALQGRLISPLLLDQVNGTLGAGAISEIRILTPGTLRPNHTTQEERPAPPQNTPYPSRVGNDAPPEFHAARTALAARSGPIVAGPRPARTDEDKCTGYHQARAGLRTTRTTSPPEPEEAPRARAEGYHRARAGLRPTAPPPSPGAAPSEATPGYLQALHNLRSSKVLSPAVPQ